MDIPKLSGIEGFRKKLECKIKMNFLVFVLNINQRYYIFEITFISMTDQIAGFCPSPPEKCNRVLG